MKFITLILFSFTVLCSLFSQQGYLPDEFIVQYQETATAQEIQAVRDVYGVDDYIYLGTKVELWKGIDFPIEANDNGEVSIILNIEQLFGHINSQDGTNARTKVQEGELNWTIYQANTDQLANLPKLDPLPFCPEDDNDMLIAPAISTNENWNRTVIIVDQQAIEGSEPINESSVKIMNPSGSVLLGVDPATQNTYDIVRSGTSSHANKVISIISNQLKQAGISDVVFFNFVLFDANGVGTYDRILNLMLELNRGVIEGVPTENLIINFSAVLFGFSQENEHYPILQNALSRFLDERRSLIFSSAGNQGWSDAQIYPAAFGLDREISVAGTEQCFTQPWAFTNSNSNLFDVASEAKNLFAVSDYKKVELVSGTSYSTASATSAVIQVIEHLDSFDPDEIKNILLQSANQVPSMASVCNLGRVLNATAAVDMAQGNNTGLRQIETTPEASQTRGLSLSPNPFTNTTQVYLPIPANAPATLRLYNSTGQQVAQREWSATASGQDIWWESPADLPVGMYFLQVQMGQESQQLTLIKQ